MPEAGGGVEGIQLIGENGTNWGGGGRGGDVREGGGQGSHRESHHCLLSLPLKEVSPSPLMCYLASCIFPKSFTVRFDKARAFSNFQC